MSGKNVSRRNVLKKFGETAAGLTALGAGTAAAGGTLEIVVWPQRDSDTDEASNEIFNALAHFLDQLQANNAIGSYSLVVKDETLKSKWGLTYDETKCDDDSWFTDFQKKITNNGYDENVHMAVTDQTNFANAKGEGWGGNEPGFAYVGTDGGYPSTSEDTERYKNAAIQETGHVIINESHIPDCSCDKEHALGWINVTDWDNYTGPSTPMVVFYEEDDLNPCYSSTEQAKKGDCENGDFVDWDGTHQRDVTDCTIDAVKATNDNDGY